MLVSRSRLRMIIKEEIERSLLQERYRRRLGKTVLDMRISLVDGTEYGSRVADVLDNRVNVRRSDRSTVRAISGILERMLESAESAAEAYISLASTSVRNAIQAGDLVQLEITVPTREGMRRARRGSRYEVVRISTGSGAAGEATDYDLRMQYLEGLGEAVADAVEAIGVSGDNHPINVNIEIRSAKRSLVEPDVESPWGELPDDSPIPDEPIVGGDEDQGGLPDRLEVIYGLDPLDPEDDSPPYDQTGMDIMGSLQMLYRYYLEGFVLYFSEDNEDCHSAQRAGCVPEMLVGPSYMPPDNTLSFEDFIDHIIGQQTDVGLYAPGTRTGYRAGSASRQQVLDYLNHITMWLPFLATALGQPWEMEIRTLGDYQEAMRRKRIVADPESEGFEAAVIVVEPEETDSVPFNFPGSDTDPECGDDEFMGPWGSKCYTCPEGLVLIGDMCKGCPDGYELVDGNTRCSRVE